MFKGLSTLRKQERKAAVDTEETKKLQAYLSKYTSAAGTSPKLFLHQGRCISGPIQTHRVEQHKLSIQGCALCDSLAEHHLMAGHDAAQEEKALRRRGKRRKQWPQPQHCALWTRMPPASGQGPLYACRAMTRMMLRTQMKVHRHFYMLGINLCDAHQCCSPHNYAHRGSYTSLVCVGCHETCQHCLSTASQRCCFTWHVMKVVAAVQMLL